MQILYSLSSSRSAVNQIRSTLLAAATAALLSMTSGAFADEVSNIAVGESYYIWGITENFLVSVDEIDTSLAQAKVAYQDGRSRWVSISRLKTNADPTSKDLGIVALLLRKAICTIKTCQQAGSTTISPIFISAEQSTPPSPAPIESAGFGYTSPGCYLGFSGLDLSYFMYRDQKFEYGIQIDAVDKNMPASHADLLKGDVIWEIDDMLVSNMQFLKSHINSSLTCTTHKIRLIRDQQILEATIMAVQK